MGRLADSLKPKQTLCKFALLLAEHADEDDLAVIDDVDNVTNAAIHEFVCTNWALVGRTVISEHRRSACSCYRGGAA